MDTLGGPLLYTLLLWWTGTGVILYLDGLPRWTFKWSLLSISVLLAVALLGLHATRNDTRITGAYLAFTCTIIVWGWQEMAFLMGVVTGPRRQACPAGARGWRRVGYAVQAILYHEIALLVLGAAVLALTWGGSNQVGPWAFATLWAMRLSAKLNVFFGVRNLSETFLPEHLRYLQTYFRRRPMNSFFPASVLLATGVTVWVWQGGLHGDAVLLLRDSRFAATATSFIGTLLTLALLEHGFMVLPLPSEALWRWGLRSHARPVSEPVRPQDAC